MNDKTFSVEVLIVDEKNLNNIETLVLQKKITNENSNKNRKKQSATQK